VKTSYLFSASHALPEKLFQKNILLRIMEKLFIIQLVASFFIGGFAISFLSFVAEKVPKNISGLILSFPVMMALGFFFIGLIISPQIVAEIIPSTLIPLGLSVLSYFGSLSMTFILMKISNFKYIKKS